MTYRREDAPEALVLSRSVIRQKHPGGDHVAHSTNASSRARGRNHKALRLAHENKNDDDNNKHIEPIAVVYT